MTGRTALEIERGLDVLIVQQYILWSDRQYTNSIILLKGWWARAEREGTLKTDKQQG